MRDGPPDAGPGSPTAGDPIGGHRVVEPNAALPAVASRLDPRPDLWDREVRVELTDIVLAEEDHAGILRQAGGDPARMRAALLEAAAERGGLPTHLHGTALVGRVAARAEGAPDGPAVGDRMVVLPPVASVPCWLHDVSGWNGGRRIPVAGHAVLAPRTPTVPVRDDLSAEVAVGLGLAWHVPDTVEQVGSERGTRTLVTGPTSIAGAAAQLTAVQHGARVAALVTTLHDARLVRALGPGDPVIVAPADTVEGVEAVLETLGGPPEVVLVADPDRDLLRLVATLVAPNGRILLLVPGADVDGLLLDAAGTGSSPSVVAARRLAPGSPAVLELWDDRPAFRALVEWRAGLAPAPRGAPITGDDEREGT